MTAVARYVPNEELSGRQKAAVLCLVLGSEAAAKLTQRLNPDEVEALSYEIARMERIDTAAVETIIEEWTTELRAADTLASGGIDAARDMLEKALGARKAQTVLERIQNQLADHAGLHRLRNADPQQLGSMLRGEHPQTAALILAHLEPQHTASVLKELETAMGADIVYRMARMEKVAPELLQLIEHSLAVETDLAINRGTSSSGGPAVVAAVLNFVPGTLEKALLESVAGRDQPLCDQIKNLMFVFEDIATLDAKSLQRLLRDIDVKTLALSLKAASEDLKKKMVGAMTQRAAQALADEVETLGPVRLRTVEEAQATVVAQVRALEDSGEIVLSGGDNDVVV